MSIENDFKRAQIKHTLVHHCKKFTKYGDRVDVISGLGIIVAAVYFGGTFVSSFWGKRSDLQEANDSTILSSEDRLEIVSHTWNNTLYALFISIQVFVGSLAFAYIMHYFVRVMMVKEYQQASEAMMELIPYIHSHEELNALYLEVHDLPIIDEEVREKMINTFLTRLNS